MPCSQKRSSQSRGNSQRPKPTVSALTLGKAHLSPVFLPGSRVGHAVLPPDEEDQLVDADITAAVSIDRAKQRPELLFGDHLRRHLPAFANGSDKLAEVKLS